MKDRIKILFLTPHPEEGASTRYRVKQFFPYFNSNGIECIFRPFIDSGCYRILYKNGYFFKKGFSLIKGMVKRAGEFINICNLDIVFVHLEASPLGIPVFERLFSFYKKPLIYDLDDAIYMKSISPANRLAYFLKNPTKISDIIRISSHIIVCNEYLGQYARRFNPNVTMIPTSIDTDRFIVRDYKENNNKKVVIGWIGSHSTARYLTQLDGVFKRLSTRHNFVLKIIGAGKNNYFHGLKEASYSDWALDTELSEFMSLDIGIYPLPDDEWVKGKTGFKTIQYMSVGVPCVVSRVARNIEIVEDGVNGFLAGSEEEWLEKLSRLIENPELRKRMGLAGRISMEARFSIKANAPKYIEVFRKVYNERYGKRNS
ncbi:MAG: glycosyltransferase family 4 protein [Candidatus Omnitrophica bacterium]|nr:glycosyltransferase family 4 protein [Candidatus Omnitrophota bacterium]